MSVAPAKHKRRVTIPEELRSARSKLIYLYLDSCGDATIEDISDDLNIPVIALCRTFRTLEKRGIVSRDGNTYHV